MTIAQYLRARIQALTLESQAVAADLSDICRRYAEEDPATVYRNERGITGHFPAHLDGTIRALRELKDLLAHVEREAHQ